MKRKISYPKESTITLNISSFEKGINTLFDNNLTSLDYAKSIKNFAFTDGALKNSLGFDNFARQLSSINHETLERDLESIESINRIFYFYKFNKETNKRDDKLLIVTSSLQLYYINLFEKEPTLYSIRNINLTSTPQAVRYRLNGEDVIILTNQTDNMIVWNGIDDPYEVLDAPKISSMTLHYERLFATVDGEKNSIWFSDDLDPTNWSVNLDEAGFIEFVDEQGALIKVVSFLDYVYIFREYGISRLSAFGNQSSFSVSNLFVSTGKINADSVCICGDKIIFLASDGLYRFDGVDTVKILDNISNNLKIDNKNISSCFYNGCYYLSCNFMFFKNDNSTEIEPAILEIDISNYKLKSITAGIETNYLCALNTNTISGILAVTKQKNNNEFVITILKENSSKYLNNTLEKSWLSQTSSINNPYNLKTLKFISLETKGDINLLLYCDNKTYSYKINKSSTPQIKRVNIPLKNFAFEIKSNDTISDIKNLKFTFSSVKDTY